MTKAMVKKTMVTAFLLLLVLVVIRQSANVSVSMIGGQVKTQVAEATTTIYTTVTNSSTTTTTRVIFYSTTTAYVTNTSTLLVPTEIELRPTYTTQITTVGTVSTLTITTRPWLRPFEDYLPFVLLIGGVLTGFGATVALWNPRRAKRSGRLAGAGLGLSAVLGVLAALAGYVYPESFLFFVLGVAAGFLSALVVGRFPELD